jgi:hypothetical protein
MKMKIEETLYELTSEYMQILQMADDPEVDEEAFEGSLESIGGLIEIKAESYARVIKELERMKSITHADAESFKAEYERKIDHEKLISNRIDRIKQNLSKAMILTDKRKFDTDNFKFYIKANTSTIIDDESAVPDEYCKFERKVSKTEIKNAINAGKEVAGAHLETKEGVVIR